MTTTFYIVRHGYNDMIGRALAGRLPGVCLNEQGRQEARRVAERLAGASIQQIFSSPMERCRETATPLVDRLQLRLNISEALNEVDYGDWSGKTLEELRNVEGWAIWNNYRSGCQVPNGETILRIQARMVGEMQRLHREYRGQTIAVFSHGDPIRSVLCFFLGMPLDLLPRMEVSPASINTLTLSDHGPRILGINDCP